MSFTATPKGATKMDVKWDISDQTNGVSASITITQTEWVNGEPQGPVQIHDATGASGSFTFTNLQPVTLYNYQLNAAWNLDDGSTFSSLVNSDSLQLLIAAETGSLFTDITDARIVFNAICVRKGSYQRTTTNILNAPFDAWITAIPTPISIQGLLSRTAGSLFNSAWTNKTVQPDGTTKSQQQLDELQAAQNLTKQAQKKGASFSDVSATLPSSGNVLAQVSSPVSAEKPGALQIIYNLSGATMSFVYGALSGRYQIDFDAGLLIKSPVPFTPFTLAINTSIFSSNASVSAENAGADFNDFGEALAEIFSGAFFGFTDTLEFAVVNGVDANLSSTDVPQLDQFFGVLGVIGDFAQADGFVQVTAEIANNALTFGFIHPTDPAPVLYNASGRLNDGPPPTLALTQNTWAKPGASLKVVGANFPLDAARQLTVGWANTSAVNPSQGVLSFGIPLLGNFTQKTLPYPASGDYLYTASGLEAGKVYEFLACCEDKYTSSAWSAPLILTAPGASAPVELYLNAASAPGHSGPLIGSAPLSPVTGAWTASVVIPANTAPGDYIITAMLSGNILAYVPIIILGAQPVLHVLSDGTTPPTVRLAPINVIGGENFPVQGLGFAPGSVTLGFSGETATFPATADASGTFVINLTAPGDRASQGPVTLTATGGDGKASVVIIELGIFMV
jgi:hypothetical protein